MGLFLGAFACGEPSSAPSGYPEGDAVSETDAAGLFEDAGPLPARACNGAAHLCPRRFDQISFATTHNAMASEERMWFAPNQHHALPRQLQDGVRGLMLDVHYGEDDEVRLCHGDCAFGSEMLSAGFAEIDAFLTTHPNEVVAIIFESYVTPPDLQEVLDASGLGAKAYRPTPGRAWPTLGEMIDDGTRLVILSDVRADPARFPQQAYVWDHAWETHWHAEQPADLGCDPNRGEPGHPLFILNHFLTYPVALEHLAESVNYDPGFSARVAQCREESGRLPNFVTVDFYDIGDVLTVVEALNAP